MNVSLSGGILERAGYGIPHCAAQHAASKQLCDGTPVYFSWVDTDENVLLSLVPIPFTAVMIAIETPAASSAYSIAVAPDSSFRKARSIRIAEPKERRQKRRLAKIAEKRTPAEILWGAVGRGISLSQKGQRRPAQLRWMGGLVSERLMRGRYLTSALSGSPFGPAGPATIPSITFPS